MRKFILALAITSCLSMRSLSAKEASIAPNFELQVINQRKVGLSNYKNKQPVLLFFWTTWCPFCRRELKVLNEKYKELVKSGWELLAIDVGEPVHRVDNYLKNYPLPFKVLLDEDATVARSYEILGVPTYVLVDKKGYIIYEENEFPQNIKSLFQNK